MNHNFKIGEKVIVFRRFNSEFGYKWISLMDKTFNKQGTITEIEDDMIRVLFKNKDCWYYPYFCLTNYRLEKLNKILDE